MKQKESDIQSIIIRYLSILENQGKLWFSRLNNIPPVNKGPNGMTFRRLPPGSKKGLPDIIVLFGSRCLALEVKTNTGRQSSEQKDVEAAFMKQGHEYHIVRSLEDVQNILKG
ncbi:MAG: VRR-NUC domain-containing protein [Paraclostridium sp.]